MTKITNGIRFLLQRIILTFHGRQFVKCGKLENFDADKNVL